MASIAVGHPNEFDEKDSRGTQKSQGEETENIATVASFRKLWLKVTDDSGLTLHGFRRFKTTHLLNLRFLEEEIDGLDHQIYQAGLKLGHTPTSTDKLGLRYIKIDANAMGVEQVVTRGLVLKLRDLLKQYGMLDHGHTTPCN